MKSRKDRNVVFLFFLLLPSAAFAHGTEVLTTMFLEFIVLVVAIVVVWKIKLRRKDKLIIAGVFVMATALTFIFINNFPYLQYQTMINMIVVAFPLASIVVAYFILWRISG